MITNGSASPLPRTTPDLEAIKTHLATLAHTQPCPRCNGAVAPVIADVTGLLGTLAQVRGELAHARLHNANLRAAISAALGAAEDGEADPLDYLRWEFPEGAFPEPGRGRP